MKYDYPLKGFRPLRGLTLVCLCQTNVSVLFVIHSTPSNYKDIKKLFSNFVTNGSKGAS